MKNSLHNQLMLKMLGLIYIIHALISLIVYKLLAVYVAGGNIEYIKTVGMPLPSPGQALFIYAFIGVLILGIFITFGIKRAFSKKFDWQPRVGFREVILLNLIPIMALFIAIYVACDPLISIAVYLALLIALVYFRDY